MIRPATPADLSALIELGKSMHAESVYSHLPFDAAKVSTLLVQLMNGSGCVFVAERDGRVIGGFAGGIAPHYFCDVLMAFDFALFVRKDKRGALAAAYLVEAYVDWALERGIDPRNIQLGISTGVDFERTASFYSRMAFEQVGGIFRMRG